MTSVTRNVAHTTDYLRSRTNEQLGAASASTIVAAKVVIPTVYTVVVAFINITVEPSISTSSVAVA